MNHHKQNQLLTVGEGLHFFNPSFHEVLEKQDDRALLKMARQQITGGAMALDINLGPSQSMARLLPWIVQVIQEQYPIPLFLPAGVPRIEQILDGHRGRATLNAVTADPAHLSRMMNIAKDYDANLVVLLTKPGIQRRDAAQRLHLALEVLELADSVAIPVNQLFLDPVFSVRADPMSWNVNGGVPDLDSMIQTLSLIGELHHQRVKTLLSLSSGTMGMQPEKRSPLHCRMLPLLLEAGLDGVLCNCCDKALMDVVRCLPSYGQQLAA